MATSLRSGCAHFVDSSRRASNPTACNVARLSNRPKRRGTERSLREGFGLRLNRTLDKAVVHAVAKRAGTSRIPLALPAIMLGPHDLNRAIVIRRGVITTVSSVPGTFQFREGTHEKAVPSPLRLFV